MENKLNLNISIRAQNLHCTFGDLYNLIQGNYNIIMDGAVKYILFYYLKLPSYDLFSPTTVLWQNSHQKNLFATTKKLRYVWYPCSLYELHWLPVFYCIYFKILSIISESISNRSCSRYSLRLHWFIVLDHPKECMPATLGTRLFSTALLHRRTAFLCISMISNHCALLRDMSKHIFLY